MGAKVGGGGGGRFTIPTNAEMNVTPLVDVMLVLLIIFMVVAPLATVSIKLDLPPAQPPRNIEKPKPPVFITIQESGALFMAERETSLETLVADLTATFQGQGAANPTEERVFVRAERNVRYDSFMAVLNQLQDGGFYSIALVGEDLS